MPYSQNFRVARGKGEVKIPKKNKKPWFVGFGGGGSVAWKLGFLHLSSNYASISHTLHQCGSHKATPIISTNHLLYFCAIVCCVIQPLKHLHSWQP